MLKQDFDHYILFEALKIAHVFKQPSSMPFHLCCSLGSIRFQKGVTGKPGSACQYAQERGQQ